MTRRFIPAESPINGCRTVELHSAESLCNGGFALPWLGCGFSQSRFDDFKNRVIEVGRDFLSEPSNSEFRLEANNAVIGLDFSRPMIFINVDLPAPLRPR